MDARNKHTLLQDGRSLFAKQDVFFITGVEAYSLELGLTLLELYNLIIYLLSGEYA